MPFEPSPLFRRALIEPLVPALEVGAVTGAAGLAVGGTAGIFTSAHPTMFAGVAAFQCFFLGTSYFYTRGVILAGLLGKRSKGNDMTASGLAGVIAGAASGALRSRSNIIPGAIMVGLMGMTGQAAFHTIADLPVAEGGKKPLVDRIAEARWLPLRSLPDEEYEKMLDEKLLSIDAEIALVDQQIAQLRRPGDSNTSKPSNPIK